MMRRLTLCCLLAVAAGALLVGIGESFNMRALLLPAALLLAGGGIGAGIALAPARISGFSFSPRAAGDAFAVLFCAPAFVALAAAVASAPTAGGVTISLALLVLLSSLFVIGVRALARRARARARAPDSGKAA